MEGALTEVNGTTSPLGGLTDLSHGCPPIYQNLGTPYKQISVVPGVKPVLVAVTPVHTPSPRKLNPQQIESIWLLSGLGKSPKDISKALKVSRHTVIKYLSGRDLSPEDKSTLSEARISAARAFASRAASRGMQIIESLTNTELNKVHPTQRAVIAGILIDKAKVLDDRANGMLVSQGMYTTLPSTTLLPQRDISAVMESIRGKISKLTILQADIDPHLAQRAILCDPGAK
jgi:hypothetical protein